MSHYKVVLEKWTTIKRQVEYVVEADDKEEAEAAAFEAAWDVREPISAVETEDFDETSDWHVIVDAKVVVEGGPT